MEKDWLVPLFLLLPLKILFREYFVAVLGQPGGFVTQGLQCVEQAALGVFQ